MNEIKQLERIKMAKEISYLLDTLDEVQKSADLTSKYMSTLALVLATESCSGAAAAGDEEAIATN